MPFEPDFGNSQKRIHFKNKLLFLGIDPIFYSYNVV